jgi:hypothetical protein
MSVDFSRVWHEWQAQLYRLSIFLQQLANLALRPQTGPFHAITQRRSLLFIPQLLNSPAKFLPAFVLQPLKILVIKKIGDSTDRPPSASFNIPPIAATRPS